MLNRIILIGRLTRDPELRYTPNGTPVAKFTLAVDRRPGKDGKKEADFIDIVVWNKMAEVCANYLGKGRLAAVDGRLQIRAYDDRDGIRRKAVEVIAESVKILEWNKDNQNNSNSNYSSTSTSKNDNFGENFEGEVSFVDDDIPF